MNWILLELKIGEIFAFDFRSPYYTNFRRYSSLSRIIEYILVPTMEHRVCKYSPTKFIVLLFFPPIDLQMNARQGCTGGGRELHTHVLSRLFRDRTLVERIRESTIFSPTIYRGNDPFEHVPASTSREMKNFFLLTRNKDANILAFA